jgi:hypothetical protein
MANLTKPLARHYIVLQVVTALLFLQVLQGYQLLWLEQVAVVDSPTIKQ